MLRSRFHHITWAFLVLAAGLPATALAGEEDAKFQATLVWGTNDAEVEDATLKPVTPAVARKLGKLPFKWEHYYTVEVKDFSVPVGKRRKVRLSEECEILVKAIDAEKVELALRGQGKAVGKVTQKLSGDHMLVTGGNCENLTAWFVVLRRR
jgi:hypothetical protein